MKPTIGVDEDWGVLVSFLPEDWERLAIRTDALKGLRRNKSAEKCLRTLLMHLACGYSLRETALRAQQYVVPGSGYRIAVRRVDAQSAGADRE